MIIQHPSPHHGARPAALPIDCIVLHADASPHEAGTINWITHPDSKVSYHYLVGRDGLVHQFVADERRAWHAGKSRFLGRPDCNDYALGICFSNDQRDESFPGVQVDAGVVLVAAKCIEYGIPLTRITTHADVAIPKGRKVDPGQLFPLATFLARVRNVLDAGVQP